MRTRSSALILLLLATPLTLFAGNMPAGAWAGTWKFNPQKSKFTGPPPRVDQFTTQPDGRITVAETNAEGKSSKWTYLPESGQAVPVEGRGPNVTVIAKQVNAHRTEQTWNFNGKTANSWAILSKDGKTQTFHQEGTDKNGKHFQETVVYEKQ